MRYIYVNVKFPRRTTYYLRFDPYGSGHRAIEDFYRTCVAASGNPKHYITTIESGSV